MATDLRLKEDLPGLTCSNSRDVPVDQEKINHLGHCPRRCRTWRPSSTSSTISRKSSFPVIGARQNLHYGNVAYHIGDLVDSLHDALTQQFARALRHDYDLRNNSSCGGGSDIDFEALGQAKALEFLDKIPQVRELLASDVQAAYDGDPAATSLDEIIFCYPGLEAITVQRLAHELYTLKVPIIPRMMTEWAHSRTGIDIHPGANIGPSFFIDHGTGVVIGETTDIASHVKIYQGVTLGALSFPKDENGNIIRGRKRHPTIEERVVIYANATILGGDTVVSLVRRSEPAFR